MNLTQCGKSAFIYIQGKVERRLKGVVYTKDAAMELEPKSGTSIDDPKEIESFLGIFHALRQTVIDLPDSARKSAFMHLVVILEGIGRELYPKAMGKLNDNETTVKTISNDSKFNPSNIGKAIAARFNPHYKTMDAESIQMNKKAFEVEKFLKIFKDIKMFTYQLPDSVRKGIYIEFRKMFYELLQEFYPEEIARLDEPTAEPEEFSRFPFTEDSAIDPSTLGRSIADRFNPHRMKNQSISKTKDTIGLLYK